MKYHVRDHSLRFCPLPKSQNGAVLIISLLMLLIMTLLGVTAMSSTTLQEKMAGNMRDRNTAMQASESALKAAEAGLTTLTARPLETPGCNTATCVWPRGVAPDLGNQSASWWTSNGLEYGNADTVEITGVSQDPRYVVEAQAYIPDNLDAGQETITGKSYYRITSRATGATDDAQVILQSTYVRRFN